MRLSPPCSHIAGPMTRGRVLDFAAPAARAVASGAFVATSHWPRFRLCDADVACPPPCIGSGAEQRIKPMAREASDEVKEVVVEEEAEERVPQAPCAPPPYSTLTGGSRYKPVRGREQRAARRHWG